MIQAVVGSNQEHEVGVVPVRTNEIVGKKRQMINENKRQKGTNESMERKEGWHHDDSSTYQSNHT
jgi:hypothetical protein